MPRTCTISKLKSHTDEGVVRGGKVREAGVEDDIADDTAVFGCWWVGAEVIDARGRKVGKSEFSLKFS